MTVKDGAAVSGKAVFFIGDISGTFLTVGSDIIKARLCTGIELVRDFDNGAMTLRPTAG
jgi:hypothetical protein